MDQHNALLEEYRVCLPKERHIINGLAYVIGFVLFLSPFLYRYTFLFAMVTLVYFFSVFTFLIFQSGIVSIWMRISFITHDIASDVTRISRRVKMGYQFALEELKYFRRNILAFPMARARWETLFFSFAVAWANVFPSSKEKKIGS